MFNWSEGNEVDWAPGMHYRRGKGGAGGGAPLPQADLVSHTGGAGGVK